MKIKSIGLSSNQEPTGGFIRGFGYNAIDSAIEDTRGFLVYQEQTMAIVGAIVYGDENTSFSEALEMAESARRIIAKKKEKELPALKEAWERGCLEKQIDEETKNILWDALYASAEYQFNKSHAANYTVYSTQLAWFKDKYPDYFSAERMNIKPDEKDIWLRHCALNDIKVVPPKINVSTTEWVVKDGVIHAPLSFLHGMGNKAKKIVAKQPFTSVTDFQERVEGRECSQKDKLALYMLGYFDNIKGDFNDLITQYEIEEVEQGWIVWKYDSEPQKRNNGKIKRRSVKDENGKKIGMEEYVFEGKKDIAYEIFNEYDKFYHFTNGSILYTKTFTEALNKLDNLGYEVSKVSKIKEETYVNKFNKEQKRYLIYCDNNDKESLSIPEWLLNKYDDVFIPEPLTYIAFKRSPRYGKAIHFRVEEPYTYRNKKGELKESYKREGAELFSLQELLTTPIQKTDP